MSNYFCFINNNSIKQGYIYNINDDKLTIYDENVNALDYNDNYLIYSKSNILFIMDIKTLIIVKMIHINYTETDYDFIHISDIIINKQIFICRVNYLTYYLDRQGLFYKKSAMMTFNIDTLEKLYETESFNVYNMIASNTKIIGRNLNKIIVFNEKLEILSEINSTQNYYVKTLLGYDNIFLTNDTNYISPDNKYIFLLKNRTFEIWDIERTILYEIIEAYGINNINVIITNDYRIIYWTDKINIIKTSLYNSLINMIRHNLQNYLPIELIDIIIKR